MLKIKEKSTEKKPRKIFKFKEAETQIARVTPGPRPPRRSLFLPTALMS